MKNVRRRLLKWAIILGGITVCLLVALPYVLPPIVEEIAINKLSSLGYPFDVSMKLRYCWTSTGPGVQSNVRVSIMDTPWTATGEFMAAPCQWHATARVKETEFTESDRTLYKLLEQHPVKAVSNLTFSGKIALEAEAHRTFDHPIAKWEVKAKLMDASAEMCSKDKPITFQQLNMAAGLSGIGKHIDIHPLFPRARSLTYANFALSNVVMTIRATEKAMIINEATADFFGGKLNLYSCFLDRKDLDAGLTLFLEDIDAGQALTAFPNFKGQATGRLHGKLKLFLKEGGKGLRLRDAFLYSVPGEIGNLQLSDAESMTDTLALAGLDEDNRANVAKALADVDYSVLRFNLKRQSEDEASLNVCLEGKATRGEITVPVVLNITLHGAIEQLINTGLKLNNKRKGKGK